MYVGAGRSLQDAPSKLWTSSWLVALLSVGHVQMDPYRSDRIAVLVAFDHLPTSRILRKSPVAVLGMVPRISPSRARWAL